MHSHANRAGYLDLDGCTIVDLLPRYIPIQQPLSSLIHYLDQATNFLHSNFIPTCSECSTPYHAPGVSAVRGESAMAFCRHCHKKMGMYLNI